MTLPQPGQTWAHVKTGRTYNIIAVGRVESDLTPVVVYGASHDVWVRPLAEFLEPVDHDGETVPRFVLRSAIGGK